jgi:hypothetical protein
MPQEQLPRSFCIPAHTIPLKSGTIHHDLANHERIRPVLSDVDSSLSTMRHHDLYQVSFL